MFGIHIHVSPLECRRRLLIAESDLNRAQLSDDWQRLAHGVHALTRPAKAVGAWVSAAALLVAGLMAQRSAAPPPGTANAAWFQKLLTSVRLASTIWLAFRARDPKEGPG